MIATYPVEDMGKEVAEQALDEYLINGKSLREWISILSDELTMLDKIRTEIEETYINITYRENKDRKATWGLRKALEIIDKYKTERHKVEREE